MHILFIICLYVLTIVILYPLVPSFFNIPTAPGVATVTELTNYMRILLVAFNLFIPYHIWKIFELLAKLFFLDRDKVKMQKWMNKQNNTLPVLNKQTKEGIVMSSIT